MVGTDLGNGNSGEVKAVGDRVRVRKDRGIMASIFEVRCDNSRCWDEGVNGIAPRGGNR